MKPGDKVTAQFEVMECRECDGLRYAELVCLVCDLRGGLDDLKPPHVEWECNCFDWLEEAAILNDGR